MKWLGLFVAGGMVAGAVVLLVLGLRDDRPREVGTLVATWSQVDHDFDVLDPIRHKHLLVDRVQRDEFAALLVGELAEGGEAVASVDMDDNVLVVAAYSECGNQGRVTVNAAGTELAFEAPTREDLLCDWSPLRVQVWQVSRSDLAPDTQPVLVER